MDSSLRSWRKVAGGIADTELADEWGRLGVVSAHVEGDGDDGFGESENGTWGGRACLSSGFAKKKSGMEERQLEEGQD